MELNSKAKEILKDITKLKEAGPVKPNYTSYTRRGKARSRRGKL